MKHEDFYWACVKEIDYSGGFRASVSQGTFVSFDPYDLIVFISWPDEKQNMIKKYGEKWDVLSDIIFELNRAVISRGIDRNKVLRRMLAGKSFVFYGNQWADEDFITAKAMGFAKTAKQAETIVDRSLEEFI